MNSNFVVESCWVAYALRNPRRISLLWLAKSQLANQDGVAFPLAMILLVILTLLSLTFMTLGSVEPQISKNLVDGSQAHSVAESGVEWGINQLAGLDFNDPSLLGSGLTTGGSNCGPGVTCKVLVVGQVMPGLTAVRGTFTVTLRNDYLASDQMLVGDGTVIDPSASLDVNKIVIIKATGTVNGAKREVTAVVRRGNLTINAALNLPGARAEVSTDVPPCPNCYSVDGRDWRISDTSAPTGVGVLKFAVAASTPTLETVAEGGFDTLPKRDYLHGLADGDGYSATTDGANLTGATGNGRNSVADNPTMTSAAVVGLINHLANRPGVVQPGPCAISSSAGGLVVCQGDIVVTGSVVGTGILVASGGTITVEGGLAWLGLVIASKAVFSPGSTVDIRGALVINADPGGTGPIWTNNASSMLIRSSKPALDNALFGPANLRVTLWRRD